MKVNIDPETGAVSFDVDDVDQALEIAAKLKARNGDIVENVPAPTRPVVANDDVTAAADAVGMTQAQYMTWDYLVQHEGSPNGVTSSAIARGLHISRMAVASRMQVLIEMGFAERISRGRFKAVIP